MFLILFELFIVTLWVNASGIYHENTKLTFYPDSDSTYFGFTVLLSSKKLMVGAPKAYVTNRRMTTGAIFECPLSDLDAKNMSCTPVDVIRRALFNTYLSQDMWVGASMAFLTPEKFMTCGPRYTKTYRDELYLMYGVCFLKSEKYRELIFRPVSDKYRLAYVTDGSRKEYGEYGTHLNFYAYGQAGMSMKVTENNTVIIGAPGLLQWTGGVVTLRFSQNENSNYLTMLTTPNLYFTKELGPDDYFGYSVESGVFEPLGMVLSVAGAPRSQKGYGQVLIFETPTIEHAPLNVRYKLKGPQLGAYFGASLCCLDINGDRLSDLLVGAPNYATKDGVSYDQGAVFVYMTVPELNHKYELRPVEFVMGSATNGARFGTAIAGLGDIDGDGYHEAAIGAPWENDGTGAVYIYRGSPAGLTSDYAQRIVAENSQSFGIGLTKGIDVDNNYCNDLVVGAAKSSTVYLYRCVPSIALFATIKVPGAMNLPHNATGFAALFCIDVPDTPLWSHLSLDVTAKITIDPENNRAMITGDSEYKINVTPGSESCKEHNVEVKPLADLSKPILMKLEIEAEELLKDDSTVFNPNAARVSERSALSSSFLIQLVRDCGEDMICTPWLVMTLEPLNSTYIPGTDTKLGAILTIFNKEEPAYGARVNITLPMITKRVPSECTLEGFKMYCDVPAPLFRNTEIVWEIELEYSVRDSKPFNVSIVAEIEDSLYYRNVTEESRVELVIGVDYKASFNVSGKSLPNTTIDITRDKFYDAENVSFVHFFEITNLGPSDWYELDAFIVIPETTKLSSPIKGCEELNNSIECVWMVPAKVSLPVVLPLRFELSTYGDILELNSTYNLTTKIIINWKEHNKSAIITTTLVLEPAPSVWPLVLGVLTGICCGCLLLAGIIYSMYKRGFFSRSRHERLKELKELSQPLTEDEHEETSSSGEGHLHNESNRELLFEDSD